MYVFLFSRLEINIYYIRTYKVTDASNWIGFYIFFKCVWDIFRSPILLLKFSLMIGIRYLFQTNVSLI